MEIKKTTKYDQFRSLTCNREIDEKHVERLMEAINKRNMLAMCPVLCNTEFKVFDGQHRIEAAKRLKVPIFYVADDSLDEEDLISLNNLKKEWRNIDYVNFWSIKKQKGFDVLSQFLSQYSWLPLTTVMELLSSDNTRNVKAIKRGQVDVSNKSDAKKIIECLAQIGNWTKVYRTNKFVRAFRKAWSHADYDQRQFICNLQEHDLEPQADENGYRKAIQNIHNAEGEFKIKIV